MRYGISVVSKPSRDMRYGITVVSKPSTEAFAFIESIQWKRKTWNLLNIPELNLQKQLAPVERHATNNRLLVSVGTSSCVLEQERLFCVGMRRQTGRRDR